MVLKILLGLIGLGIVVFVHELGHFLAAVFTGIEVEAFSIGWGMPILKKKIGKVEYRLGLFPLGGYCKMKGENDYQEVWDQYTADKNKKPDIPKGNFLSVSPFRRIIVSFMGPCANLIFAVLVLSVIWGLGFETYTLENKIVLLSDVTPGDASASGALAGGAAYPAEAAGIKTGDRIIEIKGQKINNYSDIQENIAVNAEVSLPVKVDRNGSIISLVVKPSLEKSTGAGKIGIYNWTDPVLGGVADGSPAAAAGLMAGDRILKINGTDIPYTVALIPLMENNPAVLDIEYQRDNRILQTTLYMPAAAGAAAAGSEGSGSAAGTAISGDTGPADPGFLWETVKVVYPRLNPLAALAKGTAETWKTFTVSVRSLTLLFRGVDLTQAVSGPVRITYMMGEIATEGFQQSLGIGISSMANFLALISIALCIMNLLPLPVLDGGMIVLHAIEAARRKPVPPRFIGIFQTAGVVIIFGLMIFAVFGDILFLVKR
ncbi:MAG: site-2 protease family protein [Treponema sp.]|nr:site-2 protease family protein [Treponema sp.]